MIAGNIDKPLRSLRAALLVPAVALNLLAGLGAAVLAFGNARDSVTLLSSHLHREIAQRVVQKLDSFLSRPPRLLLTHAATLETGQIPFDDPVALRRYFARQISIHDGINSHYLGWPQGGMVGAGTEDGKTYITGTNGPEAGEWRKSWVGPDSTAVGTISALPTFDARQRPWFKRAQEAHGVVWSDIYILFTGQDMALTASMAIRDDQNTLRGVIATDTFLSRIGEFLREIHQNQPGLTFIVDDSEQLVASSSPEPPFIPAAGTTPARRITAATSGNAVMEAAMAALSAQSSGQYMITVAGNRHAIVVQPYVGAPGLSWRVLVAVPEDTYLGSLDAANLRTMLLIAATLCLTAGLGLWLAHGLNRSITAIGAGAQAISEGQLEHRVAVPTVAELAELAHSFNRMADALQQARNEQARHMAEITRAEGDLRHKNEELERSNAELEYFAYVASHDLREPLRNVTSYSTLLGKRLEGRISDDEKEFLGFIHDGGLRMDALVRDLLDFARVGRHGESMAETDFAEVIETARINLRVQMQECGGTITVTTALPVLRAYRRDMVSLIQNLLANALKYRQSDVAPAITVACRRDEEGWHFTITDNGIGLAPGLDYEERIFRLFQRLHQRDQFGGGTGVGLAICKKVVERHGGRIWVTSPGPNQGATLHFSLPDPPPAD
ncbi:ATP-binding protein [Magnetospirillum gryphiswaldense]|uniref:histidine kinase n=1 Tax=Magnetospirillum gryphiswaldense TaxID=55518 RepID=A4TY56_9PROT|nr:ATP-binding protein [Magnetospirillum gryphiswaldense]AVM76079.1 Phytochrome-like protein cph1 [Magnetospirillum gryphiswaldense MSR-1]AVM79982.1 Phytochrome-like protein cph1 [Magnetospirillum gryphiswaldense]CAM75563.1 Signal transduction histidine kinase [Magnetospirillum gryphiswaldense MSR-1]